MFTINLPYVNSLHSCEVHLITKLPIMSTLKTIYEQLDLVNQQKNKMVAAQLFEQASALRDTEKKLLEEAANLEKQHRLMLSKSKYVRGLNCDKSLWLYVHKYKEQQLSDAQESIFQQGTDVGSLARGLFPNGVLAVPEGSYPNAQSAAYTLSLIQKGVTTIYEATFIFENIVVAVDVLDYKNGCWHVFEVKSSTQVKDTHYIDAAIQYYVLSGVGIFKKLNMYIVHFNKNYIRQGALHLQSLFTATQITHEVMNMQAPITANTRRLKLVMLHNEPETEMGLQCTKPFLCSFYAYCTRLLPEDHNPETNLSDEPIIQHEAIREYVQAVAYPIGFLDFETIMPAVPLFDQSRPYQQLVFQYSLHSQLNADEPIIHTERLAESNGDPRPQLIASLIEQTKDLQTIFVYNISFERSRINEMAIDFPEYAEDLDKLSYKLLDLMPVFRNDYRTESMGSKYSIKTVLPILCNDLQYDGLAIADGATASNAFMQLYNEQDTEKINNIRQQLITYCTLDTYAMVRLWEVLKRV
jgi:hypothetical protein